MNKARVRFAPSPTGYMHVANVRVALLDWIYARAHQGTFILRIEDTDQQRLIDPQAKQILADLAWLGLAFDEGPFFQSQRTELYQKYLNKLIDQGFVYRCFCSHEILEQKRMLQSTQGLPPRYDRTCAKLSKEESNARAQAGEPFIWRLKLPTESISFIDSARGVLSFDLGIFSDPSLTRPNGSFTFIFANFVDDVDMNISYVIRGEDHLTNTAVQAYLYKIFNKEIPPFYHLPIMLNKQGKKLSKRDFGLSLKDLQDGGYLPEAVNNYIATIGLSLKEEILPINELAKVVPFNEKASTGTVCYDLDKFNWINHQWIQRLDLADLILRLKPFIAKHFPKTQITDSELTRFITFIRPELTTLDDIKTKGAFFLMQPGYDTASLPSALQEILRAQKTTFKQQLETLLKTHNTSELLTSFDALNKSMCSLIKPKELFQLMRFVLTGQISGPGVKELFELLSIDEIHARIKTFVNTVI